ncbi:hypothetical protein NB688_002040 [Xanthomonas sacchari]|uniref:DNA repair protein n=1 Tax=Xanthomonas sacchari TaxID=56458 RepID=A0ABT3DWQ4_9XANT|nr:hypothetical protein [Xanthomonas sacchari]MCW0399415.1 hypothetical protein [Xanthomonas sacchari]MCW0419874.1 hypothetical protein [Xanthomonas sacchari]UYK73294.1 hypothetical protein NG828_02870 [Xanthomonas sacchari]
MAKTDDQIIWRNLSVGSPDAVTDELLENCFVDNGCLDVLRDTSSHASVVLGRTGQGKSAILLRLKSTQSNTIEIRPIELAFRFVENSTVIKFFEGAGVNLNLFYRLLWRHVLITEVVKRKFNLRDRNGLTRWFESLVDRIDRDSARARALSYLRAWGESFWEDTEVRLTEVTKKIESELSASLEGSALLGKLKAGSTDKLSDQERLEVVSRGSSVVSNIQIAELNRVMGTLANEAFDDPQDGYYIAIDSLDEEWVSSITKYRLIRALIEEVRTFRSELRNVKVILALRQDLLEKVYEQTRDGGFQEEKYEVYYARLEWSKDDLLSMLRLRVNEVFKRKYTNSSVDIGDIFPKSRGSQSAYDYMIERTMLRPRDLIAFANECFMAAANRPRISWQSIFDAEHSYSRKRKNALVDEWITTFPSVNFVLDLLRGMAETFSRSSISEEAVEALVLNVSALDGSDEVIDLCRRMFEPKASVTNAQVLSCALQILYHVGAIGVKFSSESPYIWSVNDQSNISFGEAKRVISIKVHKMLWKALEIRTAQIYRSV